MRPAHHQLRLPRPPRPVPLAYVRDLRLDRVRQDILATTDSVGTIAYRRGISHLGRFAGDYRARFHELPSATAARR